MDATALAKAVRKHAENIRSNKELEPTEADSMELVLALARIIEGKSIAQAFGAPGDWGYGTPIGSALAA